MSIALGESGDLAIISGVDARRVAGRLALALVESIAVITGLVPSATHNIVNVLAVQPGVRSVVTDTEAELGVGDETRPLVDLLAIGVDKRTDGVAESSGAVRVKLATFVTSLNVDLGEVTSTRDLCVLGGRKVVRALDGAGRHHTSTVARSSAPRHLVLFTGTNGRARRRRSPKTEIGDTIDMGGLAHGRRRVGAAAVVVALLPLF